MRMPHPLWWLRWRDVRRHVEDPATQVIAFIRSVSPPDREDPRAVEYILSKITRQAMPRQGAAGQGKARQGKEIKAWRKTDGKPTAEEACARGRGEPRVQADDRAAG